MTKYTLFIDESGDTGIVNIRTPDNGSGASPHMTMGAFLVPDENIPELRCKLEEFRKKICNSDILQCSKLGHEQKVSFARFVNNQRIQCFGMMSHKLSLEDYSDQIGGNSKKYYNKCAQYILERLGIYLEDHQISKDNVSIIFEEGPANLQQLRNLLLKCQQNPLHPNTKKLRHIEIYKIKSKNKHEESLLQISDLIAHSLHKCIHGFEYDVLEPRYLDEISSKYYKGKNKDKIIGNGIYAVHKVEDLGIRDSKVVEFLNNF